MLHWEDEVKPSPQLSVLNATGHRPEAPSPTLERLPGLH